MSWIFLWYSEHIFSFSDVSGLFQVFYLELLTLLPSILHNLSGFYIFQFFAQILTRFFAWIIAGGFSLMITTYTLSRMKHFSNLGMSAAKNYHVDRAVKPIVIQSRVPRQ